MNRRDSTHAMHKLLDRDVSSETLREATAHFARPKQSDIDKTHAAVLFRIGAEWLALPTEFLDEIADQRPIHSIPHRHNAIIVGIVNIRGELLICIALDRVLEIESQPAPHVTLHHQAPSRLIVIRRESHRLVFIADEVHGIVRFHPDELRAVPATVAKSATSFTKGMLPWDKSKTAGLLDEELLFYTLSRGLA